MIYHNYKKDRLKWLMFSNSKYAIMFSSSQLAKLISYKCLDTFLFIIRIL